MTDLGAIGLSTSSARDINDAGAITGFFYYSSTTGYHGFLYQAGTMSDIGTLGGVYTVARSINNSDQIVGHSHITGQVDHAFLYQNGTMIDLGTFGGKYSDAWEVNELGHVVGQAMTSGDAAAHAYLWAEGVMSDLGTFGGNSFGIGVNNQDQVVGSSNYYDGGYVHAFLYSGGTMLDLGTLKGGNSSQAEDINNNGQIVGYFTTSSNEDRAFLYENGAMMDLNDLIPSHSGWTLNWAFEINDFDSIVGYGVSPNGQTHGFLLTPVPEPAGLITFATALGRILLRNRRGRSGAWRATGAGRGTGVIAADACVRY